MTTEYKTDWDKYHARAKDEIKTDILATCYHNRIHPKTTAQILFSAGIPMKAENVQKFFAGREKYLAAKIAENKAKESTA